MLKRKLFFLLLSIIGISFQSCDKVKDRDGDNSEPFLLSFYLTPDLNPGIKDTINSIIKNDTIYLLCRDLYTCQNLIPVFSGNYVSCQVGGQNSIVDSLLRFFLRI